MRILTPGMDGSLNCAKFKSRWHLAILGHLDWNDREGEALRVLCDVQLTRDSRSANWAENDGGAVKGNGERVLRRKRALEQATMAHFFFAAARQKSSHKQLRWNHLAIRFELKLFARRRRAACWDGPTLIPFAE